MDFPPCLSKILTQCKSELPTGPYISKRLEQAVDGIGGICNYVYGVFRISNVRIGKLRHIGVFYEPARMIMNFDGSFTASIFATFKLCGTKNICQNEECLGYPVEFTFTHAGFSKIFTLTKKGNPKLKIEWNPATPLVDSSTTSHNWYSVFNNWSTEHLTNIIRRNLVVALETKVVDMYNDWLETCVFQNVSESVTYT